MTNQTSDICQFLDWDTDFFGKRIARVNGNHLNELGLAAIQTWCDHHKIDCLYFLADLDDVHTIRLAEDNDFRLVEVRFNLERSMKGWDPASRPRSVENVLIRDAEPADIPVLLPIAATSYVDSRYYFDEHFSESQWQSFYATWVEKSCTGGADMALVAEVSGQAVGYLTGKFDKEKPKAGFFELTGLCESMRKFGIGQELFRSGLDWFAQHDVEYMWLVTQGRNVATQRMVQRCGFITRSCQLYYHKWFTE